MAGHSKWKNIKHKKAASDAVKGRVFSKIAKEIVVAARAGGGDPNANIALRAIILKARAANMPADNIERAIKRGTGEIAGAALEEVMYEGYAAGGVALVIQALTDNRNRTAAEIRHAFTTHHNSLAGSGSVMRNFKRKGQFTISAAQVSEDRLLEIALDAGAEDVQKDDDVFEVLCEPSQFGAVSEALAKAGIKPDEAEIALVPDTYVPVTDKGQAGQLMAFIECLEELDDVQNVYVNADIAAEMVDG
jgi:YebC/PmpR family DNA-binding regulatory protein